jgi:hypothetical protein
MGSVTELHPPEIQEQIRPRRVEQAIGRGDPGSAGAVCLTRLAHSKSQHIGAHAPRPVLTVRG